MDGIARRRMVATAGTVNSPPTLTLRPARFLPPPPRRCRPRPLRSASAAWIGGFDGKGDPMSLSVSDVNSAGSTTNPAPVIPGSAVSGQDFLQLLVTQLQNQ